MSIWGKLAGIGGIVAAPFTGGTSLAWVPAALGGASAIDSMLSKPKGQPGQGGGDASTKIDQNFMNELSASSKLMGDTGRSTMASGQSQVDQTRDQFNPLLQQNQRMISGDMDEALSVLGPQVDAIGQQFQGVRNMISNQPRGGGKTSAMAMAPIEQIRMLSNLVSQGRADAATNQTNVLGRLLSSGESERQLGFQGTQSANDMMLEQGNLLLGKGNQDVAKRGQNIDIGSKIAETVAELGFLLKGGDKVGKSSYPGASTPPFVGNPGSYDVGRFSNLLEGLI